MKFAVIVIFLAVCVEKHYLSTAAKESDRLLAGRDRNAKLNRCRELHGLPRQEPQKRLSALELLRELTGHDPKICPHCGKGHLMPVLSFPNLLPARGPPALKQAA